MDRARKSPENRCTDVDCERADDRGKKWPYIYENTWEHYDEIDDCRSLLHKIYIGWFIHLHRGKYHLKTVLMLFPSWLRLKLLSNPFIFIKLNLLYNPLRGLVAYEALPWPKGEQQEIFDKIHLAMKKALNYGSKERRCAAANVLINDFKDAAAQEPFLHFIKDEDPIIRIRVIQSLGHLGISNPDLKDAFGNALLEALRDPNKEVRCQAAYALSLSAQAGDFNVNISRVIEALMQCKEDRDPAFQMYIAYAVFKLGDIIFSEQLVQIILDRKHQCRKGLFSKLSTYADTRLNESQDILEAYEKVALDGTDTLQRNALQLLYDNYGPKYGMLYQAASKSPQARVRKLASRMLVKIEGEYSRNCISDKNVRGDVI